MRQDSTQLTTLSCTLSAQRICWFVSDKDLTTLSLEVLVVKDEDVEFIRKSKPQEMMSVGSWGNWSDARSPLLTALSAVVSLQGVEPLLTIGRVRQEGEKKKAAR